MGLHGANWLRAAALAPALLLLAPSGAGAAAGHPRAAARAAAHATATGTEQDGYGRITLAFDALPPHSVELRNGILIIRFAEPVDADVGPVADGLPHFVALGRRDPDRRALRFSLSQDVKVHTLQGGDTLFVDL